MDSRIPRTDSESAEFSSPSSEKSENSDLADLLSRVKRLSPVQKALVAKELFEASGVTVLFGNSVTTADVVTQIHSMEKPDLGSVLNAVASRIERL